MKKLLNKQLQNDCLRYLHQKINEKLHKRLVLKMR